MKFDLPGQLPDIHGFGILVALGFVLGGKLAMRKATRDGLDPEVVNRLITWIIVGVFVGGHWGHAFFYEPAEYLKNPIELLKFWDGLSSFGGFIACTLLVWGWFRIQNRTRRREKKAPYPFWPYADALGMGGVLGFGFGRIGCFSAHDHPGRETDFWLAVYGTPAGSVCPGKGPGVACHDLGLYEAIFCLSLAGVLVLLDKKPRFAGFMVAVTCLVYGPARLFFDTLRAPGIDARYFGFTPAQYGAIVLFLVGIAIVAKQHKAPPQRTLPPQWDPQKGDVSGEGALPG